MGLNAICHEVPQVAREPTAVSRTLASTAALSRFRIALYKVVSSAQAASQTDGGSWSSASLIWRRIESGLIRYIAAQWDEFRELQIYGHSCQREWAD